jgi:hypothetical protein
LLALHPEIECGKIVATSEQTDTHLPHFLALLASTAALIVFAIHANLPQRDGSWCPYTSPRTGRYFMRRRIGGKWQYRAPTADETAEYHQNLFD